MTLTTNERDILTAIVERCGLAAVRQAIADIEREQVAAQVWQSLPDVKLRILRKGDQL